MNPGWLSAAKDSAFGEAAPACLVCGDDRRLEQVGVGVVPCPLCQPVVLRVPFRVDTPRGDDAA